MNTQSWFRESPGKRVLRNGNTDVSSRKNSPKRLFAQQLFLASIALTLALVTDAKAVTIGGEEFDKILSVNSPQDAGYWENGKFFTFQGDDNYPKPINISSVGYRDPSLNGITFSQVFSMGAANPQSGKLTMGTVELFGPGKEVLLKAEYESGGDLDAIYRSGYAGQLNIDGLFRPVSGSLFDAGLVDQLLYITIAFDYVWQNQRDDLKLNRGTFTFYQHAVDGEPPNPPTDIPEPMSMGLLLTGLAGAARLRQKKAGY